MGGENGRKPYSVMWKEGQGEVEETEEGVVLYVGIKVISLVLYVGIKVNSLVFYVGI